MTRWITLLASIIIAGVGARSVNAQDIASLERNIQLAEQTLKNEPYLTAHCQLLKTGDYFFHRGRHKAGKPAVVSLAAWEAFLKRRTAAGRLRQDEADRFLQAAKRRRSEVQDACSIDAMKAELARLRRPKVSVSAPATFAWGRYPGGGPVLNGEGTLTGSYRAWGFTGKAKPSWDQEGKLQVSVECNGTLDGDALAKANDPGKMTCRAEWVDAKGKKNVWACTGAGQSRIGWSVGYYWFGIWEGLCVGTVTAGDKTESAKFGLVGLRSPTWKED